MKPSNYNYLKRMWTRELCKRNWGCSRIFITPFKYIFLFISFPFWFPFGVLYAVFKNSSHKKRTNNVKNSFDYRNEIVGIESMYLDWAKKSAEIVNTTYSPIEFWHNLDEVIYYLSELSKIENDRPNIFTVSPSANLDRIYKNIKQTKLNFIERSHDKKVFWNEISQFMNQFDKECIALINAYRKENTKERVNNFYYSDHIRKQQKKDKERQELENFMASCNAYVERQEEMSEYKEYYGINDD